MRSSKRKGIMVFILCLMAFLFTFELIVFSMIKISRERIMGQKNRLTAESLARAGMQYAENMISQKKWKPNYIVPCPGKISGDLQQLKGGFVLRETFDSPVMANPGGIFRLSLMSHEGRFYRVTSTGMMGRQTFQIYREFPDSFPPGEKRIPGSITSPLKQTFPLNMESREEPADYAPMPRRSPVVIITPTVTVTPDGNRYVPQEEPPNGENPPLPDVY